MILWIIICVMNGIYSTSILTFSSDCTGCLLQICQIVKFLNLCIDCSKVVKGHLHVCLPAIYIRIKELSIFQGTIRISMSLGENVVVFKQNMSPPPLHNPTPTPPPPPPPPNFVLLDAILRVECYRIH
ncbi:hypothetical protein I3760_14G011700 [Carya illinoinensis]|nr:hypothetical protein I3760_14G011700 [Carya illinoinensis]